MLDLKSFSYSLLIHVFTCLFFYFLGTQITSLLPITDSIINAPMSSVRVDMVGLPDLTVNELKEISAIPQKEPVAAPSESKESSTPVETVKPEKADDTNNDDAIAIKESGKIKKNIKKNLAKKNESKDKSKKFLSSLSSLANQDVKTTSNLKRSLSGYVLKGNVIQKGTSSFGQSGASDPNEWISYGYEVVESIKPNWKLPYYLLKEKLMCRVRIYLDKEGTLTKWEYLSSSPNPEFNAAAVDSILKTKDFPLPNPSLLSRIARGELVIGFPL